MVRRRSRVVDLGRADTEPDAPPARPGPARWIEGPVSDVRPHIGMSWPLRDGVWYRESSMVARMGDVLFDPRTLHVELLTAPLLAPHHLAQAHQQVRAELDSYLWEVGVQQFDLWPEALHRCRSSSQLYGPLPWYVIDPTEAGQRRVAEARRWEERSNRTIAANRAALGLPIEDPPAPSIATHCPGCGTATVHDHLRRVFRCPACGWHD